jgi:anti-sigma regulatory factor (Ser/Thr protein kinase)
MTTTEQSSGPPAPDPSTTPWVGGEVPARPESVPRVRRAIVEFARRHGASAELAGDIGLAVSEAVDNSVMHAYGARGDGVGMVHYAADVGDGDLEIVIADQGTGIREDAQSNGLGLGLRLIAALSSDFAISARPEGLEVWMRFALGGAV